eukprot:CAMPEP_0179620918 /NCGR_PEP_ID=MMETSP0932-20121108/918_1 /TAXON_ID=548131 ORGANISM="Ostreococcus mediterraneus, Strain clade-D-RCC2596" /NCGR_SAMPLE_ID=MMETSP0932 /ASSEMBLY_ACC=CAM_ASM_000582 /LENGTH=73 /DNA_ID=CAMNT_0021489939 /DNA_START=297 /DNA_END=515 /DNA_ORIENTATION=+
MATTTQHANAPSPNPFCAPTPVASAVTNALCDDGNPPLDTASAGRNRPPLATKCVHGFSACATTTPVTAAMSP